MNGQFWLYKCVEMCAGVVQAPPKGRKRRATDSTCEDCLTMTLTGGVHPPGAATSVDALNIASNPVGREDPEFLKYIIITRSVLVNAVIDYRCPCSFVNLKGATFIFSDEEREADWCGRIDRVCEDCRGVTGDVSIVNQCSDRIMCPNLAMKLIELLERLKNCTENTSKFIFHKKCTQI